MSFLQLLHCLLLRNVAYVRSLPRQVRRARRTLFYRHARDTWPRPRQAASAAGIATIVLWAGSLAPLYVQSESALPQGAPSCSDFLWTVMAARLLFVMGLATAAVFCAARTFAPERSGNCMEQLVMLPLNRRRLLLARMLPSLEPLLTCAVLLFCLDLAGVLTAVLLHGRGDAMLHLTASAFAICGVLNSFAICAVPASTKGSLLLACGAMYMNLDLAFLALVVSPFLPLMEDGAYMTGTGRWEVSCVVSGLTTCILLAFAAMTVFCVLTYRVMPRQFEVTAMGRWNRKRSEMLVERHGYGPTMHYLRQFRWWVFLSDDLGRIVRGWFAAAFVRLLRAVMPADARRHAQERAGEAGH